MISIKPGQVWKLRYADYNHDEKHYYVVECRFKEIKMCGIGISADEDEETWFPRYYFSNSDYAELVSDVE